MPLTETILKQTLEGFIDPNSGKDLIEGRALKSIKVEGNKAEVLVELGYPAKTQWKILTEQIIHHLAKGHPGAEFMVKVTSNVTAHSVQRGLKLLPGVRNIIAVASGKGGVGKSTTAVNLALALSAEGARVGIMDADIYGPSIPHMLGLSGQPQTVDGKMMEPMVAHGLQAMSIGFLVDVETPMVWRGPMVTQALDQLLNQTRWEALDYLVVDLPPGTGDIQLSLSQKVPVTGAIIVTTPQDIALLDARKGLKMFEKVGVPILGLVENMSLHICSKCGHEEAIFGSGGAERMAKDYGVDVLGQLPLDMRIREETDSGRPTVVVDAHSPIAQAYMQVARKAAIKIAERSRHIGATFPTIVVQNT